MEVRGPLTVSDPEVWKNRMTRLDALQDLVLKHIDTARDKQAEDYNRGRKLAEFNVGDVVWLKVHTL